MKVHSKCNDRPEAQGDGRFSLWEGWGEGKESGPSILYGARINMKSCVRLIYGIKTVPLREGGGERKRKLEKEEKNELICPKASRLPPSHTLLPT